jgi:hypothetical protein
MTHQAPPSPSPAGSDPGRKVAQLREALRLVEDIAGRRRSRSGEDDALDAAAGISAAYDEALPVTQRRFDMLATEASIWTAAGVEALLASGAGTPPRAAAGRLADRLEAALEAMAGLLR